MQEHFQMFARYNQWANRRIYEKAAGLTDAQYRADCGAFFGSVHRTLNHLLTTDRIWLNRFTGEGPAYDRLDMVLHEDLPALRTAREAEDRRIIAWVDTLEGAKLAATFTYVPITNPREITQPLAPALAHVFNHQTHHRGQLHAMLTGLSGRDAGPVLDLVAFQRESGIGT